MAIKITAWNCPFCRENWKAIENGEAPERSAASSFLRAKLIKAAIPRRAGVQHAPVGNSCRRPVFAQRSACFSSGNLNRANWESYNLPARKRFSLCVRWQGASPQTANMTRCVPGGVIQFLQEQESLQRKVRFTSSSKRLPSATRSRETHSMLCRQT